MGDIITMENTARMENSPIKDRAKRFFHWINRDYIALFFVLWFTTGITIDERDTRKFNLQQMVVDSIVSYGTFSIGHSKLKIFRPAGDTFRTEHGTLPAKQPGQFATGAIPYFFLSIIGITYEKDYTLAAGMVAWLSASLISSIALTLLFLTMRNWGFNRNYSLLSVLSCGVFSHWIVYSGVAHHDILAASYLIIALYFSEKSLRFGDAEKWWFSILTGIFAGLTVFTSMLPALIVMTFGIYIMMTLKFRHIFFTGVGFLLGLMPLAIYNGYYFGNPFTQANVAGNFSDTFIKFSYQQFIHRVDAYIGWGGLSIWKYAPLLGLGYFGFFLLPKNLMRVKYFVFGAVIVHLFYLFNIETKGTCQYGPRYLIPLLPLMSIGVGAILHSCRNTPPFILGLIFGGFAAYGLWVSLVGAIGGAAQCDLKSFIFIKYLNDHSKLRLQNLVFFWPMLSGLMIVLIWIAIVNFKSLLGYFRTNFVAKREY